MTEAGRIDDAVTLGYAALRRAAGALELPRDVLRVAGPDTLTFLQGQLTQDVTTIADGESAWSLLLAPQGKVVALLRVTRESGESVLLDTDGGWGDAVVERLQRFKLRVKCDIEPVAWRCVAVRGPEAAAVVSSGGAADGGSDLAVAADWPGLAGVDLLGPEPTAPAGAVACPLEAYEAVRIECGIPAMGSELDERTIPAEAGVVDLTVSFTKGCYTCQELVARIDSRGGNVPRRLRGLVFDDDRSSPPVGAEVRHDERQVGSITSVTRSPGRGATVALAYVGRAVSPPAQVDVVWNGTTLGARVETLPLAP